MILIFSERNKLGKSILDSDGWKGWNRKIPGKAYRDEQMLESTMRNGSKSKKYRKMLHKIQCN